ncbi:MAG: hypothetical protein ABSA67_06700 [Candidatus Brocadiia bacterium]|jgi:chromosome segregation ATPase
MWYLRALAVVAVAVPLVIGTGCSSVSKAKYDQDIMAAQKKTDAAQKKADAAQKQLDQVRKDLKTVQDQLAANSRSLADLKAVQNEAADQKTRADRLQSQLAETQALLDQARKDLGAETQKTGKLQQEVDAQKAMEAELAAAKKALADIAKKLESAAPPANQ